MGCSVCSASATNIWRCLSRKPEYMGMHWSGNQEVEVGDASVTIKDIYSLVEILFPSPATLNYIGWKYLFLV